MSLRQSKMAKLVVSSMLLSASLPVFAAEKQVACPSFDKIQNAWKNLDTILKDKISENLFYVSTDRPVIRDAENNIAWRVGSVARGVPDFNAAMVAAQNNLQSVTGIKYAILDSTVAYYCYYNANGVVAAWADKPVSGGSVKKVMLNLHS